MLLLVALTLAAALAGGLVWATRSKSGTPHLAPLESNYSVDEAQDFTQFPIYYAGESVNGYPLTAVERDTNPTQVISFLYGDCTPPVDSDGHYDGGCGLPVEVQVWPACFRNPGLYGGPGSSTKTTVRGVPAAFYEGGNRLEMTASAARLSLPVEALGSAYEQAIPDLLT